VDKLEEDEIDVIEIFLVLWQSKWQVIIFMIVSSILFGTYAFTIPDEFRASAILSSSSGGGRSAISERFGGLAGLDVGSDSVTAAIEILNTWGFLDLFIRKNNLKVELAAVNGWDSQTNSLKIDPEKFDVTSNSWQKKMSSTKDYEPDSWESFKLIKKRIAITRSSLNGLILISADHYSPYVAKKWVELLISDINSYMRERDKSEAIKKIEYLEAEAKKTNFTGLQSTIFGLIEEQIKIVMMTEVNKDYVFKVLSPPKVSEEKFKPRRALLIIFGVLIGFVLGVIYSLTKYYSKSQLNA
jgi:LPS O-antigen subunit length determinant protein (WzzB/FepE family)